MNKKVNEISPHLLKEIDNLTHEIDLTYNNSYKYDPNELKLQLRNNVINILNSILEDNIYIELSKNFYDICADKFSNKILKIFSHDLPNDFKKIKNLKIFFT